ncbi:type VII secretion-associated protein [Gordonia humi]|uniref:Type VII secretion-associated protein (TIGR03931 family) n=1 Tax=Gordonia humi TaxID=686429 RepID=A0A840EV44_9ACTN|nr:type VII secretion-associated protein [Gordonia humi]MBB4135552.1 type VII secretion-associated protein (TIGR03931 family) [Gordonia humi]
MTGVVDLAYGEHDQAVAELLEHIDDPAWSITVSVANGETTCPTVWGSRRIAELRRRLDGADVVPRAIAVARSHTDATATRCAVIETALLPAVGRYWSAHLLVLCDGDWAITAGLVTAPDEVAADSDWAAMIAAVDLVVVDGPDEESIDAAMRTIPAATTGVLRADRALVARHGGREPSMRESIEAAVGPPPAPSPRSKTPLAVGAALCALLAVGLALVRPGSSPAESATTEHAVGDVVVAVPADWRRSDLADDRPDDGSGVRAVFADPADGGRLIVVVTPLRPGSDRDSVSESLANRLLQRGDIGILEFAPDTVFGGRRVISYRETPASGPPIAWYVAVESGVQTSVGCQRGSGDETIHAVCSAAVGSVRARRSP